MPASPLEELRALCAEVAEHVRWTAAIGGTEVPDLGEPRPPAAAAARAAPARAHAREPARAAAPGENPGEALLRHLRGGAAASGAAPAVAPGAVGNAAVPASPPFLPGSAEPSVGGVQPPGAAPTSALGPEERVRRLTIAAAEVASCTRCALAQGRTKTVFSRGSVSAPVVFVGEGPGQNEDLTGEPFVGAAGQLLDKMIAAMGLGPDDFYICNVVKCRPPENRTPLPDEAAACAPYLRTQLEVIAPRVVVALGRCAAENLGCALPGRTWRGIWGSHQAIPVMPTYHPAYVLRSPEMKRPVWEDLQKVMQRLGRPTP